MLVTDSRKPNTSLTAWAPSALLNLCATASNHVISTRVTRKAALTTRGEPRQVETVDGHTRRQTSSKRTATAQAWATIGTASFNTMVGRVQPADARPIDPAPYEH